IDLPVIPIQRKSMNADGVNAIHHAIGPHEAQKITIAGGNASEDNGNLRVDAADRGGSQLDHFTEPLPFGIELEVPMRKVVWFVPQHKCFEHGLSPDKAMLWCDKNPVSGEMCKLSYISHVSGIVH